MLEDKTTACQIEMFFGQHCLLQSPYYRHIDIAILAHALVGIDSPYARLPIIMGRSQFSRSGADIQYLSRFQQILPQPPLIINVMIYHIVPFTDLVKLFSVARSIPLNSIQPLSGQHDIIVEIYHAVGSGGGQIISGIPSSSLGGIQPSGSQRG